MTVVKRAAILKISSGGGYPTLRFIINGGGGFKDFEKLINGGVKISGGGWDKI